MAAQVRTGRKSALFLYPVFPSDSMECNIIDMKRLKVNVILNVFIKVLLKGIPNWIGLHNF